MPKRPKTKKTRKRLNKNKKFQKCPKIHICQRHQETENNPEEDKLATNLKRKSEKPKKHEDLINERRQKNGKKISDSKIGKETE